MTRCVRETRTRLLHCARYDGPVGTVARLHARTHTHSHTLTHPNTHTHSPLGEQSQTRPLRLLISRRLTELPLRGPQHLNNNPRQKLRRKKTTRRSNINSSWSKKNTTRTEKQEREKKMLIKNGRQNATLAKICIFAYSRRCNHVRSLTLSTVFFIFSSTVLGQLLKDHSNRITNRVLRCRFKSGGEKSSVNIPRLGWQTFHHQRCGWKGYVGVASLAADGLWIKNRST